MDMGKNLALYYVPFLFALSFHELAHGWVAKKKGDNTAELMGRLNMNPLTHMDFIGTFLFPVFAIATSSSFFFGWAKPVPVNSRNLKDPTRDMFWIALAGPLSNVLLALISFFILLGLSWISFSDLILYNFLDQSLKFFMMINLALAFFNLIPLHPLDGAKVLARFLPHKTNRWLEENQNMLQLGLIVLIMSGGYHYLAIPIRWIYNYLNYLIYFFSS